VRLLKAQRARRLTARPAERERPGTEINFFQKQREGAHRKTPQKLIRRTEIKLFQKQQALGKQPYMKLKFGTIYPVSLFKLLGNISAIHNLRRL
jgi:hypothetical protein